MRISRLLLGGGGHGAEKGLPLKTIYPKGITENGGKRATPLREQLKHPAFAPMPSGFWISKHAIGFPLHPPFEYHFYKLPCAVFLIIAVWDLVFGFPTFFMKERVPGKSTHFWFHNNGGAPHHFWCYQDGWYLPNPSGVKRLRE